MIEYYSAIKKEGNLTICNNKNGPWGRYAKWNKSEKNKYNMISFMWNLRSKWTNKEKRDKHNKNRS